MSDSEKVHFLTEGIYRVSFYSFYSKLIAKEKSQNQKGK